MKQNLKRALETALRLNDRLNELDGNSLQIFPKFPTETLGSCAVASGA